MTDTPRIPGSKTKLWAYGYELVPPQPEDRLRAINVLLEREGADARDRARTWESRVVVEEHATHILVVSDSPEQNLEVNRRVEAQLRDLKAGFSLSAPMAVADESVRPSDPS
jgi:putative intracellular protease/amidase